MSASSQTTKLDGSGGSASRNPDAPTGQFSSHKERDEPMTTHGHQPGQLVGNDAVPEFSAQTLPAGTAPKESTFKPNPTDDVPSTNQQVGKDVDADAPTTSASETLGGSTSADVHQGLGKPIQGQTSSELHHDGQAHNKNPGMGLDGIKSGAQGKTVDPHLPEHADQRALDKDEARIGRGNVGGLAAEEREPEKMT